jgi:CHAT domain-containing protein
VRRKAAALTLAGQPGVRTPRQLSVAALRRSLDTDEALVDFTLLDSSLAAIVVRRQGTTRIPLRVTAAQLTTWIDALRRPLVTTPGGRIDLAHARFDAAVAESLFRALVEPLSSSLQGVTRLAIAPDGALWYVPFAALVTGRPTGARPVYLVERYELRLLPSALFLSNGNGGSALPANFRVEALSYSVPGGSAELASIQAAIGRGRLVIREGALATERAALQSTADVLHIAAHGELDDRDPLASHLQLSPQKGEDGLLHLSEVAASRLTPRLIVLTACEAVNGKLYAGEGLVGFARAFLLSGAQQVIASEWPVDATAADLTGVLYGELARGKSPGAALRAAQLSLISSPATAHPIHWAGFVAFVGH